MAIQLLQDLDKLQPRQESVRHQLLSVHAARANLLDNRLNRPAEAAVDWEQSARYAVGTERVVFRILRARSLAKTRKLDQETLDEVEQLVKGENLDGLSLYNLARVCALQSTRETDKKIKERLGCRAVELLERAKQSGYFAP